MSEEPEPESGYAAGADGYAWWRMRDGVTWRSGIGVRDWGDLADAFGPMTPLLPAERPDNVPDGAVPFVGWSAWRGERIRLFTPIGVIAGERNAETAQYLGYPIPSTKPEPTLAERLRNMADHVDRVGYFTEENAGDLLREIADELEAK